jgi:ribose transport system permease protein
MKLKSYGNFITKVFHMREVTVLIIVIVACIIMSVLSPYFLTGGNLRSLAISLSTDGIMAVGMTMLLINGGFDLSVGSVLAFGGTIAALFMGQGVNMWIAILIALVAGLLIGGINGLIVTKIGVNPLIVTLGMMSIIRSATLVVAQGYPLANIPTEFTFFGQSDLLGIPVAVIIMFIIVIVGDIMLRKSVFFRQIYYIGGNESAANLAGVNVTIVKIFTFTLASVLSIVSGLISTSRLAAAFPQAGEGSELRVISACIIGGCSLAGGEGTVFGSLLGVIILALVNNGLVLNNVSIYWQGIVSGLILIFAVTIDVLSKKRSLK